MLPEEKETPSYRFRPRSLSIQEPVPIYDDKRLRKEKPELYRSFTSNKEECLPVSVVDSKGRLIHSEPMTSTTKDAASIRLPFWKENEDSDSDRSILPKTETSFRRDLRSSWEDAKYIADDEDFDWLDENKVRNE